MLSRKKRLIGLVMAVVMMLATVTPTVALAADDPQSAAASGEAASSPAAPSGGIEVITPENGTTLTTYEQGVKDGKKKAEEHYQDPLRQVGWFAAGIGFGAIGTGVAYFKKPTKVAEGYVTDSCTPEYKKGFVDGFCEVAKKKRAASAGIGWATWVAILLASGGSGGD